MPIKQNFEIVFEREKHKLDFSFSSLSLVWVLIFFESFFLLLEFVTKTSFIIKRNDITTGRRSEIPQAQPVSSSVGVSGLTNF